MIWLVVWVVLMLFWLFYEGQGVDSAKGRLAVAGSFIPWLCVLILGLIIFGAITPGPIKG